MADEKRPAEWDDLASTSTEFYLLLARAARTHIKNEDQA